MVEKHLPGGRRHPRGRAPTCASPTTRTSSPRAARPIRTAPSSARGRTTGWSTLSGTRWPSPSATSSTSKRRWSCTAATPSRMWLLQEPLLPTHRLLRGDPGGETPLLRAPHAPLPPDLRLEAIVAPVRTTRCRVARGVRRGDARRPQHPRAVAAVFDVAGKAGQEISARPEAAGEFARLAEALEEIMTIFGFDLAEELWTVVGGVRVRYEVRARERACCAGSPAGSGRGERRTGPPPTGCGTSLHAEGWAVEDTSEGPVLSRR